MNVINSEMNKGVHKHVCKDDDDNYDKEEEEEEEDEEEEEVEGGNGEKRTRCV
jgi:hypothetical protein